MNLHTMRKSILMPLVFVLGQHLHALAQTNVQKPDPLVFPSLVKKDQLYAGNPLANYLALKKIEEGYLASPFKDVYLEQMKNFEQFLGFPMAGKEAMQLKAFKKNYGNKTEQLSPEYQSLPALTVIAKEAERHNIIIWGEEHHLPQTRALYYDMIQLLWEKGFRYLAAESFSDTAESRTLPYPDYHLGYYTRDPVYADAVRLAIKLGFTLVPYDNSERTGRDKKEAETLQSKVFDKDKAAKILIIAGRGHISEIIAPDGWEPMGYWLKKLTGQDPFTVFAPTMTERLTQEEQDPVYNYALQNNMLPSISIMKNTSTGGYYTNGSFDAYVFFPPVNLIHGRPDWLFSSLHRKAVAVPVSMLPKANQKVLVQAFAQGEPETAIPVDQIIITEPGSLQKLALPPGRRYWIRAVYEDETISGRVMITVD
jgi:hypothetical protein